MKSNVEKIDACKRKIKIELDAQEIEKATDDIYTEIAKTAQVPGFRRGKAPRDVLEKHHAKWANEETLKKLIPDSYQRVLRENKLEAVILPQITEVQFQPGHSLSYLATVEVSPEVEIKNYRQLKIKRKKNTVNEEQVNSALKEMQNSRAEYKKKEGSQEEEKILPALDDNLAKQIGFSNLKELQDATRNTLKVYAEYQQKKDIENQILTQLLKIATLEAPQGLVENQVQVMLKRAKADLLAKGFKKEDIEKQEKILSEKARENAISTIKLSFILSEIAKQENIKISKEELEKRAEELAAQRNISKEQLLKELEEKDLLGNVLVQMQEEKTINFLLEQAQIEQE